MQELMKLPNKKHRASPVSGNLNVADIGTKGLPKRRLEQLIEYCNIGSLYGDSFLPLKQDQTMMNQNQLHHTVGVFPAWQFRLVVLGALGQPASSMPLSMHESAKSPIPFGW